MVMLENPPAQVEHINQIIYNTRGYDDWFCFDTAYLLEQYPNFGIYNKTNPGKSKIQRNCKDIRYNFIILNIKITPNYVQYQFDVRNTLWDGNYKISRSMNPGKYHTPGSIIVTTKDDDPNILIVTCSDTSDMGDIRVCFHLSQIGEGRVLNKSTLEIETDSMYEDPYSSSIKHPGKVYINFREGSKEQRGLCPDAHVTLQPCDAWGNVISDGLIRERGTTNKFGIFNMIYSKVSRPGTYYALLTATYEDLVTSTIVKVTKYQDLHREVITSGPIKGVIKGSIHTFNIHLGLINRYGKYDSKKDSLLDGTTAQVTFITAGGVKRTQTCIANSNGYIHPRISYRKYYEPVSTLRITLPSTKEFPSISKDITVYHVWYIAKSYEDIRTECADNNGTDYIIVPPKVFKRNGDVIKITRDMTITGAKGTPRATLDGNGKRVIELAQGYGKDAKTSLHIQGLGIINGNNGIYMNEFSKLEVNNCYFTNNTHDSIHYKGSCIYNIHKEETITRNGYFEMDIHDNYFENNHGNDIHSLGNTTITHNFFKCTSHKYTQQPEPKIVNVSNGQTIYKYNKSYINTGPEPKKTNSSYAKALAWIGKGATFNNRGGHALYGDMTLPLYGSPWYNQAYTYSVYYYPYENVRTNIVCSPRSGYERKATGHASYVKRWVFYDGYHFYRWNNGRNKGNTYDPWTKSELTFPSETGVFDLKTMEFISEAYEP